MVRYRFMKDNDGHDYLVPADKWQEFFAWVEAVEKDSRLYDGEDFDKYRIGCNPGFYTFTDPKCEVN